MTLLDTHQNAFSDPDYRFMRRCLELAEKAASLGEVPVGAVVVVENDIIGEGFNQSIRLSDPTAHAEIQAMRSAASNLGNYRLPNASLYVNLEPCSMCAGAMVHARIKKLIFGATEPKAGAIISKSKFLDADYLNHSVQYATGCLAEESSELIKAFFRLRRKKSLDS